MLSTIESINNVVNDFIWGVPAMICIIGVGLYLSIRMGFIQVRKFAYAMKVTIGRIFRKREASDGALTPFQAVCTALAATVGTGNIAGVAGAIAIGGPGAVFWMWVSAVLGMCTKFSEVILAVRFRETNDKGELVGGPMYYIKNGLKKHWHWLAYLFSAFGVLTVFGTGNATQVNTITSAIDTALYNMNIIADGNTTVISTVNLIIGIVLAIVIALILIGGIKRIGQVTEKLVPFMALIYIALAIGVVLLNIKNVPSVFVSIFKGAFNPASVTGGAIGSFFMSMKKGVSRGIFSNEAGLGSAPIAAAAAQVQEPAKQGLVSMMGTIIDTLVICTMTGLSIVITGTWDMGLEGVAVTTRAFQLGLPLPDMVCSFILMVCLIFFAFTTILGWDYYSEKCLEYLSGGNMKLVKGYRWVYILAIFIGPFMTVKAVWTIADIFNGLMAIPNLIAVIALSGVVVAETKDYLDSLKK